MTEESPAPKGLRILVIVSRPLDLPDLPNLADQWALQSGLRRVQAPAYLKMLRPPTVEGLRVEILNGYDIVHFDGHGDFGRRCLNCGGLNGPGQKQCSRCEALLEDEKPSGYFAFEREDGLLDALGAEELAEMVVSLPESAPKLVFLSACESAKGGEASLQNVLLKSGVPAVLGMKESVSITATMALATPFYAGLGAGMTIAQAFKNALPALKKLENGIKIQKIPVLDGPGKDAKILQAKATGKASFEAERLYGLPEQEFVGDYIRADPPKGRKGLLSQAMDALQSKEKLVVLTGQGGIGKTVLATEAARRLAWRYLGGVFWRSAADTKDLDLDKLLNAFDNVFGPQLRTLPLDQKKDMVLNYLRNYDTASLMVVDNAESIKDENLWRFLEGIPQPSAALVTTSESLPREGKEIRIPEMEQQEANRLLWLEARRRSPHWGEHLSPEDQESLQEIAQVMKGHPLAIKLIAALLARRSISGIRDELRRNPPDEVWERFNVSYQSLSEGQRDLFSRLAVFSSSMTEKAVGRICIEDTDFNWQGDLGELERMSFLDRIEIMTQDQKGNEVTRYRYKLHPLMRQYAAGMAGEVLLARLRPRAAAYFLEYAQKSAGNFFILGLEHENLLVAMDWFIMLEKTSSSEELKAVSQSVLQFMSALYSYLDVLGYWNELDRRLRQSIVAATALGDTKKNVRWIHNLGILSQKRGNYGEAHKFYQKSREIYQKLGDKDSEARSLLNLGTLAYDTRNYNTAREFYQQSLSIFQELDDKCDEARSLHEMGMLEQTCRHYDEARKFHQQSLSIFQELDDKFDEARSLHEMGMLEQATNHYDKARMFYRQSRELSQELGDKSLLSKSLHQLAMLEQSTGQQDEARELYRQSMVIFKELGDKSGISKSLYQLAVLEQSAGQQDEARKLYQQSMEILQEMSDKEGVAILLREMGALEWSANRYDMANKFFQQSLLIFQELGDKNGVALSQAQMALLEEKIGNLKAALHLIRQAEAAFRDLGSPYAKLAGEVRQRLEQNP